MNTTQTILTLARKHLSNGAAMDSSARICVEDAVKLLDQGMDGSTMDLAFSRERSIKALGYSVGIFHTDYKRAVRLHEASR